MSDFVNFKDEVLSGNPQYYVGNDSAPKQISLATPVTESGTKLNKTFFNLFNNVLGYDEAEYEETTSSKTEIIESEASSFKPHSTDFLSETNTVLYNYQIFDGHLGFECSAFNAYRDGASNTNKMNITAFVNGVATNTLDAVNNAFSSVGDSNNYVKISFLGDNPNVQICEFKYKFNVPAKFKLKLSYSKHPSLTLSVRADSGVSVISEQIDDGYIYTVSDYTTELNLSFRTDNRVTDAQYAKIMYIGFEKFEEENTYIKLYEEYLTGNLIVGRDLDMINNERLLIQTPNYDYLSLHNLKVNNINCDMLFPNSKYEIIYDSEENKFVKVENQMSLITGSIPSGESITLDVVPKFIIAGGASPTSTNNLSLNYKTISNNTSSSINFIAYF